MLFKAYLQSTNQSIDQLHLLINHWTNQSINQSINQYYRRSDFAINQSIHPSNERVMQRDFLPVDGALSTCHAVVFAPRRLENRQEWNHSGISLFFKKIRKKHQRFFLFRHLTRSTSFTEQVSSDYPFPAQWATKICPSSLESRLWRPAIFSVMQPTSFLIFLFSRNTRWNFSSSPWTRVFCVGRLAGAFYNSNLANHWVYTDTVVWCCCGCCCWFAGCSRSGFCDGKRA